MHGAIREKKFQDLEAAKDQFSSPSLSSYTAGAWIPSLALLRRKKAVVFCLAAPLLFILLVYKGTIASPFTFRATREYSLGPHHVAAETSAGSLTAPIAQINELVGQIPGIPNLGSLDSNIIDSDGHVHNALLDKMHLEGTEALAKLQTEIEKDVAAGKLKASNHASDSDFLVHEMNKFDAKGEGVLLLLQALRDPKYTVGTDWKSVYVDRNPIGAGLFGGLDSRPKNKFTELVFQVGLPASGSNAADDNKDVPFHIKDDALQLYRLFREEWVDKMRNAHGLTVFSKSTCPYSQRAKELLRASVHAHFTVYEVDLRPDAKELQALLAELTGHKTFPTILVQDRLIGGSDDLADLDKIHALKSILASVGAV